MDDVLAQVGAEAFKLIGEYGLPVVLVVAFVWWGKQREDRMSKALTELQVFQQTELLKEQAGTREVIIQNSAVIAANTAALQAMQHVIEGCATRHRPVPVAEMSAESGG